jgi:hypothetical protein
MVAVSNVVVNSATSISTTLTAYANSVAGPQVAGGDHRRAEPDAATGDQSWDVLIFVAKGAYGEPLRRRTELDKTVCSMGPTGIAYAETTDRRERSRA